MIEARDLSYAYPGLEPVLHDVTFTIGTGVHVAVMGPSGAGKSTLALLLKGLLAPTAGTLTVDGHSAADRDGANELMRRVGIVFQNPDTTIVGTTVEREIAFGLENTGVGHDDMERRVDEVLARYDLDRLRHTDPSSLSGGEKQRLALAAVMVMGPEHLVLDEPTSLLDPAHRARILDDIHDASRRGATVIHITPFLCEARAADRVIVLGGNGLLHDGPPSGLGAMEGMFRSGGMCDVKALVDMAASTTDMAAADPPDDSTAATPHTHDTSVGGDTLILSGLSYTYEPGTPFAHDALFDVTLHIPHGTATALIGPSGSGKTTLLELAAGVSVPSRGHIDGLGGRVRAMAFQFPEDQMFGDTVGGYIAFGPRNQGRDERDIQVAVSRSLAALGLDPDRFRDRDPLTLSGGEQRRAALAGVLAMDPGILVLDEPTAGLDRAGMEHVAACLRGYVGAGGTLLFSTHDFEVAWFLSDRTAVIVDGRIETAGPTAAVFRESRWLAGL